MHRGAAAKIGGLNHDETLREWVHRFNASGLDGRFHNWTRGLVRFLPGAHGRVDEFSTDDVLGFRG
jgi:hypothetical protein